MVILCLSVFASFHAVMPQAGVAKSIARVVRVVHLLLRTRNCFQLTCPWTSENYFISMCLFPNGSSQNRKFTNLFIFYFRNSDHSKSFTK